MTSLKTNEKRKTYLYLKDNISQSFAAVVFTFNRLVGDAISNDGENLGKVCVVWSENDGIVAVGEKFMLNSPQIQSLSVYPSGRFSPFDEVTEIVKRMDRLLFILVEWQPGQPMGKHLADVHTLWPVLHDFTHS